VSLGERVTLRSPRLAAKPGASLAGPPAGEPSAGYGQSGESQRPWFWNWAGAERSLNRALQLNPNHSEGFLIYGQLLEALGRLEEGLQMKLRALERDPFSPLVHLQISLSYWNQHLYDDAIEWANKTLELDPRHPHAREHLAGAYWKKGDSDRYIAENLKHAELHGAPIEVVARLKQVYTDGGVTGVLKLGLEFAAKPHALKERRPTEFFLRLSRRAVVGESSFWVKDALFGIHRILSTL
jgi:predicted Zn-dependent protease